jgi:hypothetical protein
MATRSQHGQAARDRLDARDIRHIRSGNAKVRAVLTASRPVATIFSIDRQNEELAPRQQRIARVTRGHVSDVAFIVWNAEHLHAGPAHGAREFRQLSPQCVTSGLGVPGTYRCRHEFATEDCFHHQIP